MREGETTRRLKKALEAHQRLKERNAFVIRHVNFVQGGVPDLSISIGQFTLWLELKMLGNKPTRLQAHYIKQLGAGACVVTFSKDGREAIVSNVSLAGWLSFEQVVEEIVSQCVENEIVQPSATKCNSAEKKLIKAALEYIDLRAGDYATEDLQDAVEEYRLAL